MAGPIRRHGKQKREANFGKRNYIEHESEQQDITEEQVRHIRNQIPTSDRLLEKYKYQYKNAGKTTGYTRSMALPVLQVLLEFWYQPIAYY